jgi:hypothetical protein
VTEMRALLALLRENEAAGQGMLPVDLRVRELVLRLASKHLKILAPELGEEELIKSVAAQLAELVALLG